MAASVSCAEAPVTAKLEAELAPGSVVWSIDALRLRGATMQEAEPTDPPEEGKPAKKPAMITVPAGGLVFLPPLPCCCPVVPRRACSRLLAGPSTAGKPAARLAGFSRGSQKTATSSHGGTPAIGCHAFVGGGPVGDALHRCECGYLWRTRDRCASLVAVDGSARLSSSSLHVHSTPSHDVHLHSWLCWSSLRP